MVNVGDKFVIEVDRVFTDDNGNKLYRIKGFNSLVFDENGIEKLVKSKPQISTEGLAIYERGFGDGYVEGVRNALSSIAGQRRILTNI